MSTELITVIALGVWVLALTVLFSIIWTHYRRLAKVDKGSLQKVLDKTLVEIKANRKSIGELERGLTALARDGAGHLQRVAVERFNPFGEMGGEHSFSVAILDAAGTGVIVTGLHTREKTRMYVKSIREGKSEYELSKEEKKALAKCLRK